MTTPAGDLFVKAHDRYPFVEAILGFDGGGIANLNTTTVNFIMRLRDAPAGPPKIKKPAVIVNGNTGHVRYEWAEGDTDTPGVYRAEWEVVYPDGRKRTFPTMSYHIINVLADLDEV